MTRPVIVTPALPQGWQAFQNDQGQIYYYNCQTGVTQWDHPNKPVKKMLPVNTIGLGLAGAVTGGPLDALIGVGIGNWFDNKRTKRYQKKGYKVESAF